MAARLRKRHQQEVREKIRASQIINSLQNHVFGKKDMSPSQVTAGLGLLKKCVPDLAQTELTGKDGEDLFGKVVREIVDPSK